MTGADDANAMSSDDAAQRFERLEQLFADALELAPDARADFLARASGSDSQLAIEVASLLKAHERSESLSGIAEVAPFDSDGASGSRLGAFVVGRRIGSGGMGAVHEAARADAQFQQRVAIKFLRRSADDAVAVARFRAEQQFLAALQHPNIAELFDGGVTAMGTPYFVMEYIDGAPITVWCDAHHQSVRERLLLFRQICLAVRAAHQRLVVHRDLKPGNIFVTANKTVKLLDFGIAKLLDDTDKELAANAPKTEVGQQAFTPDYAAPEQIRGGDVYTRADIYSLGVVLFELLAGRRPVTFTSKSPVAIARGLDTLTIPRLDESLDDQRWRALSERSRDSARRRLAGDLDAIVRMALRMDPARRYASVDALLDDIDRYLDGRAVHARPDGNWYRVRKFVARRALETAAVVVAFVSLATGIIVARQQVTRVEAESARAREVTQFLTTMLGASNPESFGKDVTMREVLDSAATRLDAESLSDGLDAEVRSIIGGTYLSLGEFGEAESQLLRALASRRKASPGGDYATAMVLNQLSLVHETNGKFALADSLLIQAESLYTRFPHPDMLQEVAALENRARILSVLGRNPEALAQLRKAFALSRARGRADDPAMVTTYINAAVVMSDLGDAMEADSLAARGYEISKRANGADHPLTLSAQAVRAGTLERAGRLDDSEAMYRELASARKRVYGATHPTYAFTLFNLTDVLLRKGEWPEAAALAREVLALRGVTIEDTHPAIAVSMQYLGRALGHMDSLAAGERWLRESLALRTKNLPAGHWLLASSESALGEHFVLAKRYAEAESLLLESERKLVEASGEASPVVRDARLRIVALYDAWNRPAQSAQWKTKLTPE